VIVLRSDSVEMTEKPKLLTSFDRADELWTAPPEIARLSTKITLDKACPEPVLSQPKGKVEGRLRATCLRDDSLIQRSKTCNDENYARGCVLAFVHYLTIHSFYCRVLYDTEYSNV
jgi:hypothetical protein